MLQLSGFGAFYDADNSRKMRTRLTADSAECRTGSVGCLEPQRNMWTNIYLQMQSLLFRLVTGRINKAVNMLFADEIREKMADECRQQRATQQTGCWSSVVNKTRNQRRPLFSYLIIRSLCSAVKGDAESHTKVTTRSMSPLHQSLHNFNRINKTVIDRINIGCL